MGEQCAGARVIEATDDVADIVEITGNGRELLLAAVETHPLQNVAGDVGHETDMAKSVLGIPDCPQIAIRVANESLDFRVGFDGV